MLEQFKPVRIRYPKEATGWNQGVYTERKPMMEEAEFLLENGMCIVKNRMWTETEHTGFGIYPYIEGPAFSFFADREDWQIEVTFRNPTDEDMVVSALADGICFLKDFTVRAKEEATTSFLYASTEEDSILQFFNPTNAVSKDETVEKVLYIKSLLVKKMPQKAPNDKLTIYLASDSTVQSYEDFYYPQTGWGQVFYHFLKGSMKATDTLSDDLSYPQCHTYSMASCVVENRSIGARSARSFLAEGKWSQLLLRAHPGDICLLQWAHNDATAVRPNRYVAPADFSFYLEKYVLSCRKRGIYPVFVTPVTRRNCDDHEGSFVRAFDEYRKIMMSCGEEWNVPVVDLSKRSCDYLNEIGVEESKSIFLWTNPGDYPDGAYGDGVSDNTHLQEYGALTFAKMVCEEIQELKGFDYLEKMKELLDLSFPITKPEKTTTQRPQDKTVPSGFAMQELHVENGIANFLLIWNDVEEAVAYQVYRKGSVDFQFFPLKKVTKEEKQKEAVLPFTLPASDVYRVQVTAIFADGRESKASKTIEFRT